MKQFLRVEASFDNTRLDVFIARTTQKIGFDKGLSRSRAKRLIEAGHIEVNGSMELSPKRRVRQGDVISIVNVSKALLSICPPPKLAPQKVDFGIIYDDDYIAVIEKPPNIAVHPGAGNEEVTIAHGILYYFRDIDCNIDPIRPGIVHRLDKDTSGLLIIAKNSHSHTAMSMQFKNGEVEKRYTAIVRGNPEGKDRVIGFPIGRHPVHRKKMSIVSRSQRPAKTEWKVNRVLKGASCLDVRIYTGRTHQIRVHLASIGHPVLGDGLYGGPKFFWVNRKRVEFKRQMLHASFIAFTHPKTGKRLSFSSSIPDDMKRVIEILSHV